MSIAEHIREIMTKSSWIRKMFEEGAQLKAKHGQENVFDFSLGNPNLKPPDEFFKTLKKLLNTQGLLEHGYMPNAGFANTKQSVAKYLSEQQKPEITENEIVMTCGASGALNVILKAIINPGDEIITPVPCFVEYGYYAGNHGGTARSVPTMADFSLDIDAISSAVSDKTAAVLINSPNNPTGAVYGRDNLYELGELLRDKSKKTGRTIYLISDEPYRRLVYDSIEVPSIFSGYKDSIIATSYSKDLSIPGERIGYIAVNPDAQKKQDLLNAMALANRILGFVNAPAFMQQVIADIQGISVDIDAYKRKRDLICKGLKNCGYEFIKPSGAFYLFPKSPIQDDVKFVRALQKELILTVPGSGFGGPGHFRIAFCVDDHTIINALPGFKRVRARAKIT